MKDFYILYRAIQTAKLNSYTENPSFPHIFGEVPVDKYIHVIFSHDFAKAFWGESSLYCNAKTHINGCTSYWYRKTKGWQYHLQQMVLEKEPLKYIEKFL
jgi:hypothetical protein